MKNLPTLDDLRAGVRGWKWAFEQLPAPEDIRKVVGKWVGGPVAGISVFSTPIVDGVPKKSRNWLVRPRRKIIQLIAEKRENGV